MQNTAFDRSQADGGEFDAQEQFNVVILYDKAEAGRRAMNQIRSVTGPLAANLDLKVRLWRLDVVMDAMDATTVAGDLTKAVVELPLPLLNYLGTTTAVRDLATADLLLFALDDEESLGGIARQGLEEAVQRMRGPGTAVAILTKDAAPRSPARFDFLKKAAGEIGAEFLFPLAGSLPKGVESTIIGIYSPAKAATSKATA